MCATIGVLVMCGMTKFTLDCACIRKLKSVVSDPGRCTKAAFGLFALWLIFQWLGEITSIGRSCAELRGPISDLAINLMP